MRERERGLYIYRGRKRERKREYKKEGGREREGEREREVLTPLLIVLCSSINNCFSQLYLSLHNEYHPLVTDIDLH